MANSLNRKIGLTFFVLALLICATYGSISYRFILQQQLADKQILNRNLASDLVEELNWSSTDSINDQKWQDNLKMFMSVNPGIEVYILDRDGNVMVSGLAGDKVFQKNIDTIPILQHIEGDHMYPLIGQDPKQDELNKPFTVAPVPDTKNIQGYLYVVLESQQQIDFESGKKAKYFWLISLYLLAVSLTIGFLIAILIFRKYTARIEKLTHEVSLFKNKDLGNNQYQSRFKNDLNNDELAYLSHTFDTLATHIQSQFSYIQAINENRRNLLAGISHDIRTPLTALQGHLEILLKKSDRLSSEKRKDYLQISIKNAVRIGKLIEDLFQLSKLQAKEVELKKEEFNIEELAQDVALMLRPMAQAKGNELELNVSCEVIPTVKADIGLIERVLENLISNAINYTDLGQIVVGISNDNDNVRISVSDNGMGIHPDDQKNIFLPYYQINSHNAHRCKSGLGLAICKNILSLHEQSIEVSSKLGHGSCFSFSLDAVNPI